MRIAAGATAALVSLLSTIPARADAAHDKAMASQLFDDAEKLFGSGKSADACPKYNESYRLDPQLGTLLHLGECYAKLGKTAAAWVSFKDAVELAVQKSDPREKKIRERVHQLEATLPKLVITVPPSAPADLEVRQDGEVVARALWGTPAPLDPGVHAIAAKAPGRKPWTGNVQIAATSTIFEVKIPDLAPETAASAPGPAAAPVPQPAAAPQPQPAPPPTAVPQPSPSAVSVTSEALPVPAPGEDKKGSPGTAQRVLGWTSLGLGVVGLGVGTVFAIQRSGKLNDRDAICPDNIGCTANDQTNVNALTDDARSASTLSMVGFIAGGALAATGLVLVITAPSGAPKSESVGVLPLAGPGFEGVAIRGRL